MLFTHFNISQRQSHFFLSQRGIKGPVCAVFWRNVNCGVLLKNLFKNIIKAPV
jgi:hypothetical protein